MHSILESMFHPISSAVLPGFPLKAQEAHSPAASNATSTWGWPDQSFFKTTMLVQTNASFQTTNNCSQVWAWSIHLQTLPFSQCNCFHMHWQLAPPSLGAFQQLNPFLLLFPTDPQLQQPSLPVEEEEQLRCLPLHQGALRSRCVWDHLHPHPGQLG